MKEEKLTGRETKTDNNLFFVCSLIEYIARKTFNHRDAVVTAIGKEQLKHIFELADIYHCENIDKVSDELIDKSRLSAGTFDNITDCQYSVPTHWDIGKVYKRLILDISFRQETNLIDTLMEIYQSWINRKIENLNSSAYYENPAYLACSYLEGKMLQD
jgi:hypothetical protein